MALKYLTHLNLNQNELQNPVLHPLGTAPSTPVEGQIYYNSTVGNKKVYVYDGSAWTNISGDISEVIAGDALTGGGRYIRSYSWRCFNRRRSRWLCNIKRSSR